MRHDPRARELAVAHLVQDLARLLVAPVVLLRALARRQELEGIARRPGVHRQELVRGDQRVAAEDRHVPRDPGGEDRAVPHPRVQGAQVAQAAVQELVEHLVVGDDPRRLPLPLLVRATELVDRVVEVRGRVGGFGPQDRFDRDRDEPRLVRVEVEPEDRRGERPVDVDALRLDAEADPRDPPDVIAPLVHELDRRVLRRGRVGPARVAVRHPAHVEDVGEVRAERQPDLQGDVERVVVLDPDALEQVAGDRSDAADVDRLLGRAQHVALEQVGVRQVDVGQVAAFGRGREQHEIALVHAHTEVRQEPRVVRVQPETVLPAVVEVPLEVRVQEGLPLLDGQRLAREIGDQDRGRSLLGRRRRVRRR